MNLKDQFKKAYSEEPIEWDKDAMWGDIEKELPPVEKKKRRFLIWWFGGLFSIAGLIFICLNISKPQVSKAVGNIEKTNNELKDNETSFTNSTEIVQEKIKTEKDEKRTSNSIKNSNQIANITPPRTKNEVTKPIITKNNIKHNTKGQDIPNLNTTSLTYRASANQTQNVLHTNKESTQKNQVNIHGSEKTIAAKINNLRLLFKYPGLITYAEKNFVINKNPSSLFGAGDNHEDNSKKPLSSSLFELSIGAYLGKAYSSLDSKDDQLKSYVENLEGSKAVKESIGASAILRRKVGTNWKLGLGINYRRSFEWFSYINENVIVEEISSDQAVYAYSFGEQIFGEGTVKQTTRERSQIKSPVKRNYLDLSLEAGYVLSLKKTTLYPYVSFNPNLLHRYDGVSLDMDNSILLSGDDAQDLFYKRSKVHSISFGIDWNKPINDYITLSCGFRSNHNLNSSIQSDRMIQEFYSDVNLKLGVIYALKL